MIIYITSQVRTLEYVAHRTIKALNDQGHATSGAEILLLGVAYKTGVSDVRESPAFDVIKILEEWGANLSYHDPHVPRWTVGDNELKSRELHEQTLARQDAVVIITDHDEIDWSLVRENTNLLIDTRNVLAGTSGPGTVYPLSGPPR